MKVRNDFVTNSSSSSFIFTFKDDEDFKAFRKALEEYNYEDVYKLVNHFKRNFSHSVCREGVIDTLRLWLLHDASYEYLDEQTQDIRDWDLKQTRMEELKQTEDYQEFQKKCLSDCRFEEKSQQINNAMYVVNGSIWDSDGGIMEYAIRNGLLRQYPINKWLIAQMDIG